MSARSFLDTNVLVYTDDHDAPAKQHRALELVAECRRRRSGVVSVQVLQEYFVAATRKLGVAAPLARRKVQLFARLELIVPRLDDVLAAIDLHRLHDLSFWDAMIVRVALVAGCRRLYSEDLQHGWDVDGLEVVNPFGGG
jgi:predicted nucleic acid-binding protein